MSNRAQLPTAYKTGAGRLRPLIPQWLLPALAGILAWLGISPLAAQQSEMRFPSFNSVVAKPQGIPATGAEPEAPAPARPAPPAAKPKKSKAPRTEVASRSEQSASGRAAEAKGLSIAVLVDDEPITGYEIDQRQKLLGLSSNVGEKAQANFKRLLQDPSTTERLKAVLGEVLKANQGKSREEIIAIFEERKKQFAISLQKQAMDNARSSVLPTLRKSALDELIEEKLKLQEAKRMSVIASDEDVSRIMRSLAEKNKMTEPQFATHIASMGADIDGMRSRFRATLSWNDVIRKLYGYQITITSRDIDRVVSQGPAGEDQTELQVQLLTLAIPEKIDQKLVAQRMSEAETLKSKFTGCKTMSTLAGAVANAKFDDLGWRKPSTLTEPTKSLLLNAKDGELVPPVVGKGGVELYAVCGRQVVKADEQKRTAAQEELRQKEFEMLAKRHLQDLHEKATIDYRQAQ